MVLNWRHLKIRYISENAEALVNMLKEEDKDRPITKAFGKKVMEEHIFCRKIKFGFLRKANETGW